MNETKMIKKMDFVKVKVYFRRVKLLIMRNLFFCLIGRYFSI